MFPLQEMMCEICVILLLGIAIIALLAFIPAVIYFVIIAMKDINSHKPGGGG